MAARALALAMGLLLAVAVVAVAGDTWYALLGSAEQIGEIEVAPGVVVRADIWEDDYVPSYEELIEVGFLPEDAREFDTVLCTWGQIKVCLGSPNHDCDCRKSSG
jgi:hypothetical protein